MQALRPPACCQCQQRRHTRTSNAAAGPHLAAASLQSLLITTKPQHRQIQQQLEQPARAPSWCACSSRSTQETSREDAARREGQLDRVVADNSNSSKAVGGSRRRSINSSRFRRPGKSAAGRPPAGTDTPAAGPPAAVEGQEEQQEEAQASTSLPDDTRDHGVFTQQAHRGSGTSSNSTSSSNSSSTSASSTSSSSTAADANAPRPSASLPASQVQQLRTYLDHLLKVNQVMNLTAIRDPEEAWERHIEDSLALLPVIQQYACSSSSSSCSDSSSSSSSSHNNSSRDSQGSSQHNSQHSSSSSSSDSSSSSSSDSSNRPLRVIDVGTGAGLPGMVLAVVRPHWQVTLLDSLRKRCDFLQQTADMLGLRNVSVVWSRAEDGARQPDLREGHDVAVARAVAELRVLAELCLPFVAPGGVWVAAKGVDPEDEVAAAAKALSALSGKLVAVPRVQSWAPEGQRTAVVVRKTGRTPQRYPRAPGTPAKKPL